MSSREKGRLFSLWIVDGIQKISGVLSEGGFELNPTSPAKSAPITQAHFFFSQAGSKLVISDSRQRHRDAFWLPHKRPLATPLLLQWRCCRGDARDSPYRQSWYHNAGGSG